MINQRRVLLGDYSPFKPVQTALKNNPSDIIKEVSDSNLRGRGGASFPTGRKWSFCAAPESDIKYVVCNADEGEPGTFKDKELLIKNPESLFDGMIIAGYGIGATKGYIYIRAEYPAISRDLKDRLKHYHKKGWLGENIEDSDFSFDIEVVDGMGAYVCGEETSLLNSIEGKRGEVRVKPPFPPSKGLFDKPTLINNVETLCNIPFIIENGADWYKSIGTETSAGTKVFSVSGDVEKKGIYELELGFNMGEFIRSLGADNLKAVQISGAAGTCYGADDLDFPVTFENIVGCGSIMVFNNKRNIVDICYNFMEFFEDESCGVCTPCRQGTHQLVQLIEKIREGKGDKSTIEKLEQIAETMVLTSRCGFGQTAPSPLTSMLKLFPDEFLNYNREVVK